MKQVCETGMAAQTVVNDDISESASSTADVGIDGLECNICLQSACEPVVTLCGHLYCWPCIYKWLHVQESYAESHQEPQCPICKANISCSTLVPLYGRDDSTSKSRITEGESDLNIPNRPTFCSGNFQRILQQSSTPATQWSHSTSYLELNSEALAVVLNPLTYKFGEMVYARIFGASSDLRISSRIVSSIRQQEKKIENSLNRLSFFFFCCVILCLILF